MFRRIGHHFISIKRLPPMRETWVRSLVQEDPLEKEMVFPTPVFLPGESHGWRSLVGYSPRGHKKLDTTERLHYSLGPPGAPKHKSLSMSPVSYVQKRSFIQLP